MPRPSLQEVLASAVTSFPDNISGAITPLILRTWVGKLIEAIRPAYAYLLRPTGTQVVGIADIAVVYDTTFISGVVDYAVNAAAGTLQRLERGLTKMEFTADVVATNGTVVTFTLYKDGAATPWRQSCTGAGAGRAVSISFSTIESSSSPATYQMRVRIDTGSQTITLSEMLFIAASQPVWEYT
jgi:hypothetical protein